MVCALSCVPMVRSCGCAVMNRSHPRRTWYYARRHYCNSIRAVRQGVGIEIDKRLPMGGGLGGGSSDAATVLHALNRLWGLKLSTQQLAELGLQLGADVPVFIHGFAAFAEGVGEQLTAIELEQPWYLVITPAISVATAEIFADPELTRDSPAIKICDLFASSWDNAFTPVAAARYPEIKQALDWLSAHGHARMSGSGASVFAAFDSEDQRAVAYRLNYSYPSWPLAIFCCPGLQPVTAATVYERRVSAARRVSRQEQPDIILPEVVR